MRAVFLLFFWIFSLRAGQIELFCDWAWDAKGQDLFPLMETLPQDQLSLTSLLRRKLKERGEEIKSFEIDAYRPWLLTWKGVKNWKDFLYFLKIGLPRKQPMLENTSYWVFWNLGLKLKNLDFSSIDPEKMVLVMFEPPTVQKELYDPSVQALFGKIFTWDDDLVDNKRFFKFHYPSLVARIESLPSFEEKKFCVMICRRLTSDHPQELYSQRRKVIEFFETKEKGELDLYGFNWEKHHYKNYKGPLHSNKIEKLKEYKFSICYENMKDVKDYITEKIFDCFGAGVVPIYLGASNIFDYIPEDCFIDRRKFKGEEELYQFLKKITKEEYLHYLHCAEKFLQSEQAKKFTNEYFVNGFDQVLAEAHR